MKIEITYPCPGGCGEQVPYYRSACRWCWEQLPEEIRFAVTSTWRLEPVAHLAALEQMRAWFRDRSGIGGRPGGAFGSGIVDVPADEFADDGGPVGFGDVAETLPEVRVDADVL